MFDDIFHTMKNSKLLLLTGTPIRDRIKEIFYLLNLLLPAEKKLSPPDFSEDFDKWEKKFKKSIQGYISYIKNLTDPQVNIEYVESCQPENVITKDCKILYEDFMDGIQNRTYNKLYDSYGGKIKFGKDMDFKQIGLMVWKDDKGRALYGDKLYNKFIKEEIVGNQSDKLSDSIKEELFSKDSDKMTIFLKKSDAPSIIKGKDIKEKLANLKKFSAKYHDIIKSIIDNKDQNIFVFGELFKGSGLVMFTKILERFGFANYFSSGKGKSRYVLITSTNKGKIKDVLKVFNNPKNKSGRHIRIFIGTDVAGEGITLKNIQQIHIVTPWYNYGKILQAVARGIRYKSHQDLLKDNDEITVKVYLHGAVPVVDGKPKPKRSRDVDFYETSEDKYKKIKIIERIMKEASIDCQLEYERNYSSNSEDGSKDCDYTKCEYKCDGITNLDPKINHTNYSITLFRY